MVSSPRRRVAVIGAGISGVVSAAHLLKEDIDVTVFERSSAAGGVWVFDKRKPIEPRYSPISVFTPLQDNSDSSSEEPGPKALNAQVRQLLHAPPGPCYDGLKNNVATPLLELTLNPFPPGTPDFVTHDVLRDYIQDTAIKTGVHRNTRYNTSVKKVMKIGEKWRVETSILTRDSDSEDKEEWKEGLEDFDNVVVASGHYHEPRIPSTPGLADWKHRWPHRVLHSKSYRTPDDFPSNINILLVGGAVSATDIARELSPKVSQIYQSTRNGTFDLGPALLPENTIRVDEIASYNAPSPETSSKPLNEEGATDPIPATIELKSGRVLCGIHFVILCTGYHLTLPFLPQYQSQAQSSSSPSPKEIILTPSQTQYHNLHMDIFYIPDPTLSFIGIPFFTATFTLFEFQAMAVAKQIAGWVDLPSEEEMRGLYRERVERVRKQYGLSEQPGSGDDGGDDVGKAFHSLKDREEEYVNALVEWVNRGLERRGREERMRGHGGRWREARGEHLERLKALFAKVTDAKEGKGWLVVC